MQLQVKQNILRAFIKPIFNFHYAQHPRVDCCLNLKLFVNAYDLLLFRHTSTSKQIAYREGYKNRGVWPLSPSIQMEEYCIWHSHQPMDQSVQVAYRVVIDILSVSFCKF